MELVNHTPFPSLAFTSIDQYGQEYDVIVLRQTLSFSTGQLEYAEVQAPLIESDLFFGAPNKSTIRSESDYCLFKPNCDVIVNATAYAPGSRPVTRFDAGFAICRTEPDRTRTALLEKSVHVHGERHFVKRPKLICAAFGMLRWATLTAISMTPWKLSKATSFTSLSLRYEQAFGGHVEIEDDALASFTFEANPIGCGLTKSATVRRFRIRSVPAPRVEHPGAALTCKAFYKWQESRTPSKYAAVLYDAVCSTAGFCIRPKTHPARAALLGTVDEAFIQSNAPLPSDFDFAYFNAAPTDQQVAHLGNDEIIELRILCPPDTPCLAFDCHGNAILSLPLLRHECFALLRMEDGAMCTEPLMLDTVVIEPDTHSVSLVWRLAILKDSDSVVRVCEARMRTHEEREQLRAVQTSLAALVNNAEAKFLAETCAS